LAGIGARVSTISCLEVSSTHTSGQSGLRGFWRVVAGILYDVQFDDLLEQSKAPTGEPSGTGEQVKAINFASAAPSKIRGRAEFGLRLRFSAPSSPSSTRRRRRRPIVLSWCPASRRSSCRSNLRPHPTRPPSAGYAPSAATAPGACPQKSQRLEPLRFSELNLTTYFLTASSFPATNHLHRCVAVAEVQKAPQNQ
jgi:hypothetical protein